MNRSMKQLAVPVWTKDTLWRLAQGSGVALGSFLLLGTVSALWPNPLFVRMVPAGAWELSALLILSLLAGLFIFVRRPYCTARPAGIGGIVGFIGIACPTCNKVLLLLFGGELLLTYFEPVRLYVAAVGIAVLGFAVAREIILRDNRERAGTAKRVS